MKIAKPRASRSQKIKPSRLEITILQTLAQAPGELPGLVRNAKSDGFEERVVSISLRDYVQGSLERLERAGLVEANKKKFNLTPEGELLAKKLAKKSGGAPHTFLTSRLTVLTYLVSSLLAVFAFFLTKSAELLAWAFVLLAWICPFIVIKQQNEKKAALIIGVCLGLSGLALVSLGIYSLFSPLIVRRLIWVSLTLGLSLAGFLSLLVVSRYQAGLAVFYSSFTFTTLAHASRKHALLALLTALVCLASYLSFHFVVSIFLVLIGFRLTLSGARVFESLSKHKTGAEALSFWFEHQSRKSREKFFLAWIKQILNERSYAKSEILEIYQENFARDSVPYFDKIDISLSRDAWFDEKLDTLLGHLLYDNQIMIEDDRFGRKNRLIP